MIKDGIQMKVPTEGNRLYTGCTVGCALEQFLGLFDVNGMYHYGWMYIAGLAASQNWIENAL